MSAVSVVPYVVGLSLIKFEGQLVAVPRAYSVCFSCFITFFLVFVHNAFMSVYLWQCL